MHRFLRQALLNAQSELRIHSGLQAGLFNAFGPTQGSQIANRSPYASQGALGSHGFGEQGCAVVLSGITTMAET